MIVIIVVCVGFLMFMIVLGVIRIRSAQQRREMPVEDKPEMEWDNSALTITVNPMDQEVGRIYQCSCPLHRLSDECSHKEYCFQPCIVHTSSAKYKLSSERLCIIC